MNGAHPEIETKNIPAGNYLITHSTYEEIGQAIERLFEGANNHQGDILIEQLPGLNLEDCGKQYALQLVTKE